MPTPTTRMPAPTPVAESIRVPPRFPGLPADVLRRFPSLERWEQDDVNRWNARLVNSLEQQNRSIATTVAQTQNDARTLRVSFGQFAAEITEEVEVIADEQGAQAKRIVTVSAMAGVNENISVQATPPVGPSVGDFWLDTSVPTLVITYEWDGLSWVEVEEPIAFAGVADERTARVTADGFLSSKYTLSVISGDIITGFNITSASGPGTDVSDVAWTADQFQIYSGTAKKQMFYADGVQDKVRLSNVFTVDGASTSIYIKTTAGAGSYNSAGTPFFVDALGRMSLGTGLTFDGTNLSVSGTVTAGAGEIGGWTINSSTLSRNNAVLDSAGQLVLGTANDVVYLSATDATYRLWIGNASSGSAVFRVTKAGAVTAIAGTIGGWTLASTTLSANNAILDSAGQLILGTSNDVVYLSATDGTYRIWIGNATAGSAAFRVTKAGAMFATEATISGNSVFSGTVNIGSGATQFFVDSSELTYGTRFVIYDGGTGAFDLRAGDYALNGWFYAIASSTSSDATVSLMQNAVGLPFSFRATSSYFALDGFSTSPTGAAFYFDFLSNQLTLAGGVSVGGGSGSPVSAASGRLYLAAGGSNRWYISDTTGNFVGDGTLLKITGDGWTNKLSDGSATIEFQASGGQIFGRINGGAAILLG